MYVKYMSHLHEHLLDEANKRSAQMRNKTLPLTFSSSEFDELRLQFKSLA